MKLSKKVLFIIIAVVLVAVVTLATSSRPLQGSMIVCTKDGETAEFSYDLQYYSNWILPSYVKGTVSINGITFTDRYTVYERFNSSSNELFPLDWWKDDSNLPYNTSFYRADYSDVLSLGSNFIIVFNADFGANIDRIYFWHHNTKDRSSLDFAGPAKNAEEAKHIIQSFGYNAD